MFSEELCYASGSSQGIAGQYGFIGKVISVQDLERRGLRSSLFGAIGENIDQADRVNFSWINDSLAAGKGDAKATDFGRIGDPAKAMEGTEKALRALEEPEHLPENPFGECAFGQSEHTYLQWLCEEPEFGYNSDEDEPGTPEWGQEWWGFAIGGRV